MKKIAYLSDYPFSLAFGGKEVQMLTYKKYLSEQGLMVSLLDYWKAGDLEQYDLIHLFGHSTWFYDLIQPLKAKKKKVVVSPTFYVDNLRKLLMASLVSRVSPIPDFFSYKRGFLSKSDAIIVNSAQEKKQLVKLFGKNLFEKTSVVYNGVEKNFASFQEEQAKEIFLKKYQLTPGYFLSVAFIDERKNALRLLRAFLNTYPVLQKKLVLIGNYRFNQERHLEEARQLILSNPDKILHIPYLERESDLLKAAYFYCGAHVLPSILETPGISNLEALLFNKPILVGDCLPVREYFGNHAVYCSPKSISSIESGLAEVQKREKEKRFKDFLETHYVLERITPQIIKIYESVFV